MSYYEDERPRRRSNVRDRRDSEYYDDALYNNTRSNARTTAIVKRRDDSVDSIEEVRRDFSPPDGGGYYRETTIRKSGIRPADAHRARSFENDRFYEDDRSRYSDRRGDSYYATSRRSRDYDDRRSDRGRYSRHDSRYDDRSDYYERSRTPPKRERRKSMPEEALEALGLGGVAAAIMGKKDRSSSRERNGRARSRAGSRDGRSKSHGREQLTQALKAAVLSGAAAAFQARKEPGGWGGDKGKRVLTAAFAAGGVDGLINNHKDPEEHKLRDTLGSAIAGVATSRIVNGPRSKSRGREISPDSRRSRSRSKSRIRDVAAGGVVAAAAKKAFDSVRGRSSSRGRARSRSRSYDSYDSRSPPPKGRSRSRSVVARGLAAVGLNKQADKVDPTRRASSRGRRYSDEYTDDGYDNVGRPHSRRRSMFGRSKSIGPVAVPSPPPPGYQLDYGPHHNGDPATDSDSDLGASSEEEKEHKKSRNKLLITGGLATVATIHAGHSVYSSMEKRQARRKAVKQGKISKEEAQRNRTKDQIQEVASIGLAALGLKGAYSELKETKEARDKVQEEKERLERHAQKRAARRQKAKMIAQGPYNSEYGYSSMPDLGVQGANHRTYYADENPYAANVGATMSGAVQPQYEDGNPYGWMGHSQNNNQPPTNHSSQYVPTQAPNGTTFNNPFPPPPMGPPPPQQYH